MIFPDTQSIPEITLSDEIEKKKNFNNVCLFAFRDFRVENKYKKKYNFSSLSELCNCVIETQNEYKYMRNISQCHIHLTS